MVSRPKRRIIIKTLEFTIINLYNKASDNLNKFHYSLKNNIKHKLTFSMISLDDLIPNE